MASSAVSQRQSIMSRTGWPSTLVMTQPGVKPASSAGLSGSTDSMTAFGGSGSAALAAAHGLRSLLRHILRRINAHVNTAFPLPFTHMPVHFSQHIMVACRTR